MAGRRRRSTPQQRNESQEYVKKEERMIEAVRERAQNRDEQEAKRKQREKRKPFTPPAAHSVAGLQLSPDGKYVIASVVRPPSGRRTPSCRTTSLSRPTLKIFPAVTRLATSRSALDWRLFRSRPAT